MKKIIGILICMLMITTLFPVIGTENIMLSNQQSQIPLNIKSNSEIIEMIEQLDVTMVIGYIENLTSFGPRWKGSEECHAAGRYIHDEFEKMGLPVRYQNFSAEYHGKEFEGINVEATIAGLNQEKSEILIVCGHYDTWLKAPGADDNGAGIAAVLSLANILRQYTFNYTIRFVAFDAEEDGHFGSYNYVKEAFENNNNIIAALNADMMGNYETEEGSRKILVFDDEDYLTKSVWLTEYTANISEEYFQYINLKVVPGGYFQWSDHENFWEFGYDAILYLEHDWELNLCYHKPSDILDNMKPGTVCKSLKRHLE
jgi:hypothetical protein